MPRAAELGRVVGVSVVRGIGFGGWCRTQGHYTSHLWVVSLGYNICNANMIQYELFHSLFIMLTVQSDWRRVRGTPAFIWL